MENLLTLLPLVDRLTELGIYGRGTIRENRLQGAPSKKKDDLQKQASISFDFTSDGKNLLIAWRDNKVVIIDIVFIM